jgi:hypothetical protein
MSQAMTIERDVYFRRYGRGSPCHLEPGQKPQPAALPPGRIPRIARLMALAIRFEEQVRQGVLGSYAELAALGHVTRARVSQIMNLVNLAPDLQEALLFLPRTERGHDPIHLAQLQLIASTFDWRRQRRLWKELVQARCPGVPPGVPTGASV